VENYELLTENIIISKIIGDHFKPNPPLEVTHNLQDMKKEFYLVLKIISHKRRINVAGLLISYIFYI